MWERKWMDNGRIFLACKRKREEDEAREVWSIPVPTHHLHFHLFSWSPHTSLTPLTFSNSFSFFSRSEAMTNLAHSFHFHLLSVRAPVSQSLVRSLISPSHYLSLSFCLCVWEEKKQQEIPCSLGLLEYRSLWTCYSCVPGCMTWVWVKDSERDKVNELAGALRYLRRRWERFHLGTCCGCYWCCLLLFVLQSKQRVMDKTKNAAFVLVTPNYAFSRLKLLCVCIECVREWERKRG